MANTFPSSGFVGIGTASPNYLLDIPSNNNLYLSNLYITGCSLNPILSSGGTGGSMCLQGGGAGEGGIRLQGAAANTNGHISFLTNQVEAMRINTGGNVGIGTSGPSTKLHILNNADRAYTPNSFNDTSHAMHINFCNQNQRAGLIRFTSHGNLENSFGVVQVGCAAAGCGQGDFVFQAYREAGGVAYNELMRLTNTGNVGISTSTPSYRLHVNGTFYAAGSSQDYKQSICNYNTDSCMFMKLKPVTYQYKDEWCHLGKELKSETQIGLIAEDVAEVYPELAILVNEDDQKIVRNVDYEKLSIVLLSEVQKLRKELDELKTK
jgi:hypothetical protein